MNLFEEIHSPVAPEAQGNYAPGLKVGDFIFISGQLPLDMNGILVKGDTGVQTRRVIRNIRNLLYEKQLDLGSIVKLTVYLDKSADSDQFDEVMKSTFVSPLPALSLTYVWKLPNDALIEIDALAIDTVNYDSPSGCENCGGCCK